LLTVFCVQAAAIPDKSEVAEQAIALINKRCLMCHNATTKTKGVDLATRAAAMGSGAIVPSDAEKSRLLQMVNAGKMPPTGKLSSEELALLRQWIASGATYPKESEMAQRPLWSLQPVTNPKVPRTKFDALVKNPIDRFIFDKLAKKGLKPSPPANRLALLRRVTIDLTGLPPTPEEVVAFLNDKSPNAYEKVVDRLLASPAYGERWGRHWLDVVRFGESHGYEQNHVRPNAWHYRDYVIRSFNEDKPYTQLIAEQLAGDTLGKGNPNVEVATGFLVAGVHDTVGIQTEEGTRQQRANDLDDIVSTVGAAFLGLTTGCAKCHDHKFDPIPQRDYYRLAAVFAGVRHAERSLRAANVSERTETEESAREARIIQGKISDLDAQAQVAALRSQGVHPVPRPAVNTRRNVEDFAPVTARFVRFTVLATKDGMEPCLDELEIFAPDGEENLALAAKGAQATALSLLPGYMIHQIHHLNDGRFGNEWSWISNERGGGWAQIELPQPASISRVVWSRDSTDKPRYNDRIASAYRVEVSVDGKMWKTVSASDDRAPSSEAIPLTTLQQAMTPVQRQQREALAAELEKLRQRIATLTSGNTAYIGQFTSPDPIFVLKRGDVMQRSEEVTPGGLSQIPGLSAELQAENASEPSRRLALAKWLCDPKNPLTARVIVNRVWQHHFGRGIVGTPSDFGRNGEKPTHPELLDWLAATFVSTGQWVNQSMSKFVDPLTDLPIDSYSCGWRLKRLHKMIVTSYTYQQSSRANAQGMAVDAGNVLLWRMPLRRMEAEAVRDSILSVSGKLNRQMGGPSFQLFKYRIVNVAIYEPLDAYGPETWRRAVYAQPARAIRDDLMGNFDCPESAQRAPRRDVTTTPLQALTLLNGTFVVQQADFFAERVKREAGEKVEAQVARAFRLAFGRLPHAQEQKGAAELVSKHGLVTLCRALLNANEFLYY
jgi:cytochrome c551/c552/cytochrome c553